MTARQKNNWLPDMDLNHDKQIQSLLCYRYTIGQTRASKVECRPAESRLVTPGAGCFAKTARGCAVFRPAAAVSLFQRAATGAGAHSRAPDSP
jgi:hypothetical protein